MIAFRGVVVDDIENHLDAFVVQALHHLLEFLHLSAELAAGRVLVVRSEKADRVVSPVIPQPALHQKRIVNELLDRHELHRGDAERLQVLDDRGMRESGVRPALILRDLRMQLGESLDVHLIDDRFVPWCSGRSIVPPVEVGIGHHRLRHERRAVHLVLRILRIVEVMAEDRLVPFHFAFHGLAVRIEQELRRIATLAAVRVPRSVHAVSVSLARADLREIPMPEETGHLRQIDAALNPLLVEKAKLHAGGRFD